MLITLDVLNLYYKYLFNEGNNQNWLKQSTAIVITITNFRW
jgi:hypothetical protein